MKDIDLLMKGAARWLARVAGQDDLARRIGGPNWPLQRASGIGLNSAGGFLVPAQIANVIASFRDFAVFRANSTVYPLGSDEQYVPRRFDQVSVNFVAENAVMSESTIALDSIGFSAKKVGGFTRFSNELDEDSAADIAAFFLMDCGAALGLKEDDCGFNGDGTSTYGGIRGVVPIISDGAHAASSVTAATGHDTYGELDADDLAALMGLLPDKYWPGAKFYCSGYAAAQTFMRLGASTGGARMTATGPRPTISYGGIPVAMTPRLPGAGSQNGKIMLLFGDLASAAALGSRRELVMATSGGKYLEYDQTAFRVTERFDINAHNLGDSSVAGAVVALVGN